MASPPAEKAFAHHSSTLNNLRNRTKSPGHSSAETLKSLALKKIEAVRKPTQVMQYRSLNWKRGDVAKISSGCHFFFK
jgi:hypothetical protein